MDGLGRAIADADTVIMVVSPAQATTDLHGGSHIRKCRFTVHGMILRPEEDRKGSRTLRSQTRGPDKFPWSDDS